MRQGQQHRRGRGRTNNNGGGSSHNQGHSNNNNNRKGQNPLTRSFESNGPDVKIRGTPAHVAEKYVALARDAQTSGDPVLAENYLQHAEHYYRIILAYREQQGETGIVGGGMMRQRQTGDPSVDGEFSDDENDDFQGDGGNGQPMMRGNEPQPGGFDAPRFEDRPPNRDNNGRDNNGQRFQNQNQNRHNNRDRQDGGDQRRFQNDRPDFRGQDSRGDGRSDNRRDQQFRPEGRPERFDRGDRGPDRGNEQPAGEFRNDRDQRPQRFERPERPERFDRPERVERPEPVDRPAPVAVVPVMDAPVADAPPRRREPRVAAVPAHEQPEFLRRPVRRPRRDAAVEGAADAPADDTSGTE